MKCADLEDEEECLSPTEKEIIQEYRSLYNGRKTCIQETLRYKYIIHFEEMLNRENGVKYT